MQSRIAVIAENISQFEYFLKEIHPDDRKLFIYLHNCEQTRGLHFAGVIRIGTAYNNRNYAELLSSALIAVR